MIDENLFKINSKNKNYRILRNPNNEQRELINPICLLGMPGIGDIGKFAVDQLIGILNAEKFCDIIFYNFPAGAIIDESLLSTPKAEVLSYWDSKKKRDIILITADAQAMTPKGIYEVSDLLAELLYNFKVNEIIALGAFPGKRRSQEEIRIYITSTDEFEVKHYDGCYRISKGVIIGSNGLIPTLAKARFGIKGKVFLAETEQPSSLNEGFTDLNASVALLRFVAEHYSLPIETVFSNDKVDELANDLKKKRKQLEEELESYQPIEQLIERDKTLYI
jgi:proteasome assembly chaperone (PAC2) family protein